MVNLSNKMVNLDLELCLFLHFILFFLRLLRTFSSKIRGFDTSHSSIRQEEYSSRIAIL